MHVSKKPEGVVRKDRKTGVELQGIASNNRGGLDSDPGPIPKCHRTGTNFVVRRYDFTRPDFTSPEIAIDD